MAQFLMMQEVYTLYMALDGIHIGWKAIRHPSYLRDDHWKSHSFKCLHESFGRAMMAFALGDDLLLFCSVDADVSPMLLFHHSLTIVTSPLSPSTSPLLQTWVGVMLMRQPFFMGGIEDVEAAKGSAFGAAGTFFFTFLVSMLYMIKQARQLTGGMSRSSQGSVGSSGSAHDFLQRRQPYLDRPGTTALFHDYDPVDSTISAEELDAPGVFS
jgi:hypothetical protein